MNKYNALSASDAIAVADKIHEYLIANDEAYAASVRSNQTICWDVPRQVPAGSGKWIVFVDERGIEALTEDEQSRVTG